MKPYKCPHVGANPELVLAAGYVLRENGTSNVKATPPPFSFGVRSEPKHRFFKVYSRQQTVVERRDAAAVSMERAECLTRDRTLAHVYTQNNVNVPKESKMMPVSEYIKPIMYSR